MSTLAVPKTYAELRRGVEERLLAGQRQIEQAKVRTHWETGRLIDAHVVLFQERADYGSEVMARLARDLQVGERVLYYCLRFARFFPILPARAELSWAHYRALTHLADATQRRALMTEAVKQQWTSREVENRISTLLAAGSGRSGNGDPTAAPAKPPRLLTPKRGTPGLHLIVDRGPSTSLRAGDGLAVDLGFKLYRALDPDQQRRLAKGDIVRVTEDRITKVTTVNSEPQTSEPRPVTKSDLFTYDAIIRRVIDGDTLVIKIEVAPSVFLEEKLRLRGLDSPELSTSEGKAAKRFTESLLQPGSAVVLSTTKPDKYDRYLADVFVVPLKEEQGGGSKEQEVFLNNALLENGHGVRKDAWEFGDWEA